MTTSPPHPASAGQRPASPSVPDSGRADQHRRPWPGGTIRLNKRMARAGPGIRREADDWIAKGWVTVDGKVAR